MLKSKLIRLRLFLVILVFITSVTAIYEVYTLWQLSKNVKQKSSKINSLNEKKNELKTEIANLKEELSRKKKELKSINSFIARKFLYLSTTLRIQQALINLIVKDNVKIESSFLEDRGDFFNLSLKISGKEKNVLSFCNDILDTYPSYLGDFSISKPSNQVVLILSLRIPKVETNDEEN